MFEMHKNTSIKTLAQEAISQGYDVVAAAGGDGTINAVASAIIDNTSIKLGIIPRGTLNHFARALNIPTDMEQAVQTIVAGHLAKVDVGQVNEQIFLNNSSVGLYPAMVRMRQSLQKSGVSKWPAAIWASIRIFSRFRRLSLELQPAEGEVVQHKTSMLFVGNNAYDTAFPALGTRTSLQKGQIWIMMPKSATRPGLIAGFLKMLTGRESPADALTMEVTKLTVKSKRRSFKVALDGEVMQLQSPLEYSTRPKSLRVIVPAPRTLRG